MSNNNPFALTSPKPVGKDSKLVGSWFPYQLADYTALIAVYYNVTVSEVLRKMAQRWIEDEDPEESIIRILAGRAYREWQARLQEYRNQKYWNEAHIQTRFKEYKEEVKKYLTKRRISEYKAREVIEQMEMIYGAW